MTFRKTTLLSAFSLAIAALALVTARAQAPASQLEMKGATYWHWGTESFPYLSSEWAPPTWAHGVTGAQVTTNHPHSGEASLELTVNLVAGDNDKAAGAVQVGWYSGNNNAPCSSEHSTDCPITPLDLDGVTITAHVFAPPGSRGSGNVPNRLRLVVVSDPTSLHPHCFGAAQNIADTPAPGSWNLVTLTIGSGRDSCLGQRESGFDPAAVNNLYLEVVRGNSSYSGKLWLDDVTLSAPWSRPYDFEVTSNSLDRLSQTGVNYVALSQHWFMETRTSCLIQPFMPNATHTDAEIVATIREIHDRGMKVQLKPVVNSKDNASHADLKPADVGCWFQSYQDYMVRYAQIAQDNGVESLNIGTELNSLDTSQYRSRWAALIAEVRSKYRGPLTYGGDAYHYQQVAFWDLLDYVGIDAYLSVSDLPNPSLTEIVAGWTNYHGTNTVQEMERWQATVGKPIIFTEVGYRSIDYAGTSTGDYKVDHPYNADLQARLYQGLFTAFRGKPWLKGIFWFKWDSDPATGLCCEKSYIPQNKPAEAVLRENYGPPK